jgi:hypothetical protein
MLPFTRAGLAEQSRFFGTLIGTADWIGLSGQ